MSGPAAAAAKATPRSLASYLLLPRPKDAVKWWILPVGFVIGLLAHGGADGETVLRALIFWAALELLVYQARYQWNDIRGFEADQRHPDANERGRLPGPLEKRRERVAASGLVAGARICAALLIGVALPGLGLVWAISAAIVAVFGAAAVYEALRTRSTGSVDAVPRTPPASLVALWGFSGAGYAIRGVAGLWLAIPLLDEPTVLLAATIAMWAFGVAFVTSRWAIEALAFARCEDGTLRFSARPEHGREHSLSLARWLPRPPAGTDPRRWRPLRSVTSMRAPWNTAIVASGGAAALTGALLGGGAIAAAIAAAPAGCLMTVLVTRARHGVLAVAGGGVALMALTAVCGGARPALTALVWSAVIAAYLFFSGQSLDALGRPLRDRLSPGGAAR